MGPSKTTRPLSVEEVARFLEAAKKHRNPRYRLFFSILAYWGLRVSEAKEIRWKDIVNARYFPHELFVYQAKKRQGRNRRVMNDELSQVIAEAISAIATVEGTRPPLDELLLVVWHKGEKKSPSTIAVIKAAKAICVKAFISPLHVGNHSFRKSFANAIEDEATAQMLLGHSHVDVTRRYKTSEDKRQVAALKGITFGLHEPTLAKKK